MANILFYLFTLPQSVAFGENMKSKEFVYVKVRLEIYLHKHLKAKGMLEERSIELFN